MPRTSEDILKELNVGGGSWISADGYHAFISVQKNGSDLIFNPSAGVIVKVFLNQTTGEIKTFLGRVFDESL